MDARLQEMLDHHEIKKTLAQYCIASDRCDEPRMADVYLEDSFDDHGTIKAPGPEYARRMTASILRSSESMYHLLGQSTIRVDGDVAGAETYFLAVSRTREDGMSYVNQLGGRFVDTLHRDGDRWRIKHRKVLRDWTISLPLERDWESAQLLTPGERSNDDPCFAVLGLVHGALTPAS
jgi:ketosteroid isomerase-like protein